MVREPASFDEVVAPDESIQAAIDRCRVGGSILLQPGAYTLSESLVLAKEVHVFGRGLARLQAEHCSGVSCSAAEATLDGLIVERSQGPEKLFAGVAITGGRLRFQNSAVTGAFENGVEITDGDPLIIACRCVCAALDAVLEIISGIF